MEFVGYIFVLWSHQRNGNKKNLWFIDPFQSGWYLYLCIVLIIRMSITVKILRNIQLLIR